MTDKRSKTHKQVWIDSHLCNLAMASYIPNTEDVPQQLTWRLHYWLRRGLATGNQKTPPPK